MKFSMNGAKDRPSKSPGMRASVYVMGRDLMMERGNKTEVDSLGTEGKA